MTKIHLPARVPNEGARRLAGWLMTQPIGTYDRFAQRVGGLIAADRLLAGEVTPGRELGFSIYSFAEQTVPIRDWYRAAEGGWFDPIAPLANMRAAA